MIVPIQVMAKNPLQFMWYEYSEADHWKKSDTLFQSIFVGLTLIDWKQTHDVIGKKETITNTYDIVDQNNNVIGYRTQSYTRYAWKENNPILGEHPSKKKLAIYNVSVILGHSLISYILPNPWRKMWMGSGIGIEIYATSTNWAAGATIKF
jgi:hypothetical protein